MNEMHETGSRASRATRATTCTKSTRPFRGVHLVQAVTVMEVETYKGGEMDFYKDKWGVEMPAEFREYPPDVGLLADYCGEYMTLKEFSRFPLEERIAIARELGITPERLASAMDWY